MKSISYLMLYVSFLNLTFYWGFAQDVTSKIDSLPLIGGIHESGITDDWLIDPSEARAKVFKNEIGNDLILSNGIISRTFRIEPNVTTTSFKNITESEELIRAAGPEGIIKADGYFFNVGGLIGQPNLAFLYPDWVDNLASDPLSFHFYDFSIGSPKPRLDWNRVRHHAPGISWPPNGIHLKMNYRLLDLQPEDLVEISQNSALGRNTIYKDAFTELSDQWKIIKSETNTKGSFVHEGRVGEIYTPNNTAIYAEYQLPKGTRLVETSVDVGKDLSGAWGPGIALVWSDKIIKFNLRPGNDSGNNNNEPWMFTVFDGNRENTNAGGKNNLDLNQIWHLRIRLEGNEAFCEAKPNGGRWKTVEAISFDGDIPDPISARIGKFGPRAEGKDAPYTGDLVHLTFHDFAAYSKIQKSLLEQLETKVQDLRNLEVSVHYELYDGIPVVSKWLEIHNDSEIDFRIEEIVSEHLSIADHDPYPEHRNHPEYMSRPNIHLETNYAFSAGKSKIASVHSVHWKADQDYFTQISWRQTIPNLVQVYPERGYNVDLTPGSTLESIRTFILPYDSYEKERQGLSLRKMYRTIAPWITENPMMFHVTRSGWEEFKLAIDQAAEVGYEMVNFSFGSGFNPEDESDTNVNNMKKYADYADSKGIGIGTYSLLASRSISEKDDVINPKTGKRGGFATFLNSPCLGSEWGLDYFRKLYKIYNQTGFLTLTHDGNYPGDACASTTHPGHRDYDDSQFEQWRIITDFYKWCKSKGVYLRVPDYYYLSGSNHQGVGYRENNWSLPRRHQLIHTRQNIFDGTWESTPTMRWSFIPLAQYHGGGSAATIEPLKKHLEHYEMMLISNLGMGLQSVLRGPRIYDSETTKNMVKRVVEWYKKYRTILESDIIHLRRADGRDIDYMMHINPDNKEKGLLMVFNPTDDPITKKITVPLYYSGLNHKASIREQEGESKEYELDRGYEVQLEVTAQPNWYNWYVIE